MESRLRCVYWLAWLGLLGLAVFMRMDNLAERPVHADEATGARILAQQLEGQGYGYNPRHFHGPALSQLAYPLARLRGEDDWSSLSIATLRSSTVIGGVLLVLTPLLWLRTIGPLAALAGAAFLATSPLLVYYSRTYIHETWLAFFGMLACAGLYHLTLRPSAGKALATGAAIGLIFATKITVAISLLSWFIAAGFLFFLLKRSGAMEAGRQPYPSRSDYPKAIGYLIIGGFLCALLLYSNYLRNPAGLLEALRSFFIYEPMTGHDKPVFYYASQLLWPKQASGLWWTEMTVLLCAIAAVLVSRSSFQQRATITFLGLAGLAHFITYSCIGYKTPWLMLLPWAHFCLLAGCLMTRLSGIRRGFRAAILLLVLLGLGHQSRQSLAVTGRLENHEDNPYAYVPTSRDVESLSHWLQSLNSLQSLDPIAVVGSEYWPLPWYLRRLDVKIHYWPDGDGVKLGDYSVVLSMPAEQGIVRRQLHGTHVEHPRGLRSNVPLFLFLDLDIWNLWRQGNDSANGS
jgi:uncharacterized protein (TIGR03663 family)